MLKFVRHIVTVVALSAVGRASGDRPDTTPAVEYYHAGWGYYFLTAFPEEIAALDGGAFGGAWQRTGQSFSVWTSAVPAARPCAVFGASFAREAALLHALERGVRLGQGQSRLAVRSDRVLHEVDQLVRQLCNGTTQLYRLYNNHGMGGAPNHRYTTSQAIALQMRIAGWVLEGNGPAGVLACVPVQWPIQLRACGWLGSTSIGQTILGTVLNTGEYYFLYTSPGSNVIAGAVQGNASTSGGRLSSSNARDFNIAGYGVTAGVVAEAYMPRSSLGGTFLTAYGNSSFTAAYQGIYEQPIDLGTVAGRFSGTVSSSAGYETAIVNINASGAFAGAVTDCSFSGTVTRRGTTHRS